MTQGKEPEAQELIPPSEEKPPEPEVPTPTEPNPLEAQIQELQSQLQVKDESYKGLQKKLNQVNVDLKSRGLSESRLDTLEQTQRLLVSMLSEKESIDIAEIPSEKRADYLKQFDDVVTQQRQKGRQDELIAKVREYQERTDSLKMDVESEEYLEIRDLVIDGKFDRADKKLAKLETKVNEPKIDLEAERTKIREEEKKKLLIERGELNSETGQPSGVSLDYAQIRDAYVADPNNPVTRDRYLKARRDRGV